MMVLLSWLKKKKKKKSLSHVQLFATPWTVVYQAPPSMGFSRQEYWSGLPFPSPGDLPDPGIEPRSPALQADTLLSELLKHFPKAQPTNITTQGIRISIYELWGGSQIIAFSSDPHKNHL